MAISDASICNMALARIGVTKSITALTDTTVEGRQCNLFYEQTRDALLEAFAWPFATRQATLAVIDDIDRDDWTYAYGLPDDCLSPRSIWAGVRTPRPDQRFPFVLENDSTEGPILLCDIQDATLSYTAQVTAPGLFTKKFSDALAWALAVELSMPLKVDKATAALARQMAQLSLLQAKASTLDAQEPDQAPAPDFITGRG